MLGEKDLHAAIAAFFRRADFGLARAPPARWRRFLA
jgi:hypothetical protein